MEEANGAGKNITKTFDNVSVNDGTLEIHLYWAGKGTTAIPNRGVYGPLISAITVTPSKLPFYFNMSLFVSVSLCQCHSLYQCINDDVSFVVDFKVNTGGLSAGAIVGIVAASCVFVFLVLFALRMKGYLGGKDTDENQGEGNL